MKKKKINICPICKIQIKNIEMFCKIHWFKLPKMLRDKIWIAYKNKKRNESLELYVKAIECLKQ